MWQMAAMRDNWQSTVLRGQELPIRAVIPGQSLTASTQGQHVTPYGFVQKDCLPTPSSFMDCFAVSFTFRYGWHSSLPRQRLAV